MFPNASLQVTPLHQKEINNNKKLKTGQWIISEFPIELSVASLYILYSSDL